MEDEDKEAVCLKVYALEDYVKSNFVMTDDQWLTFTELVSSIVTELNRRF